MFVLDPPGQGLLLMGSTKALADADWWLDRRHHLHRGGRHRGAGTGFQGWLYRNAGPAVRLMLITAGFLLVYPEWWSRTAGFCLIAVSMAFQILGRRRALA